MSTKKKHAKSTSESPGGKKKRLPPRKGKSSASRKNVLALKNNDETSTLKRITVPAIKRILRRAGVRRITQSIYEKIRKDVISPLLNIILEKALIFVDYNKRKTIQIHDLKGALESLGIHLGAGLNQNTTKTFHSSVGFGHKKSNKSSKTRKFKPGTVAAREIRREQKNSDKFAIPEANFGRLAREFIANMTTEDIRFSKGVLPLVQLTVENIVVTVCRDAYKLSLHTGRETLMSSDLELVLVIKNYW